MNDLKVSNVKKQQDILKFIRGSCAKIRSLEKKIFL